MFVKVLLAIISFKCTQGFILECEFGNEEWINLGIVFQCKVHGMQLTSRNSITEVVGAPFRPIRDVKALDVQDQRCQFVPSDVQTFFPNVEGLQVANSELKELQNADMQQFPNLKQLFMSENELQSLENDVFEPCPNIEYVNLGHNNIMHMGTDIFAPLKNLQYCNFAGNGCMDTKIESPNAIQQFSKDLQKQCPPTPEMLKREMDRKIPESLRTMAPITTTTVTPELEDLREELKKLKNKIAEHDQEIDEIKSKENTTSAPLNDVADINNSPSTKSQDQPEQTVKPPPINSFNTFPEFPLQNLMDILNIPQQYPSYPSETRSPVMQNNFPEPARPQRPVPLPQDPLMKTPMSQCGPYGCVPNVPPQINAPQMSYPNPFQSPNNNLPNQFQSPYPYNQTPSENRPPFPLLMKEPDNFSRDPEVPQTPTSKQMNPSMNPPDQSQSPLPNVGNSNDCGQYGCTDSMNQPMHPEAMQNTRPLEKPSPAEPSDPGSLAPHSNLDVESGLSGMFCYIFE